MIGDELGSTVLDIDINRLDAKFWQARLQTTSQSLRTVQPAFRPCRDGEFSLMPRLVLHAGRLLEIRVS